MEIIKAFVWVVLCCFGLSVGFVLGWFITGMSVCFYKIYFKKKPKPEIKNCKHGSSFYSDSHPDKPWTCHDCGELHS